MWRDFIPEIREIIEQHKTDKDDSLQNQGEIDGDHLSARCFETLEAQGVQPAPEYIKALILAGMLGEMPNNLPYHGNHHYHKVVSQLERLIAQHQNMGGDLNDNQIAMLLIAACVHDYGHEGKASLEIPGEVEQHSFDMAKPYLASAGLDDGVLQQLNVMLLCTDVQPIGEKGNFAALTKQVYKSHYEGVTMPELPEGLAPLAKRKELALMALMLHEADIATSAGIDYTTTVHETRLFVEELTGKDEARPSHIVGFLTDVCGKEMVLPAAKALYQENMEHIFQTAKAAMESGDDILF